MTSDLIIAEQELILKMTIISNNNKWTLFTSLSLNPYQLKYTSFAESWQISVSRKIFSISKNSADQNAYLEVSPTTK